MSAGGVTQQVGGRGWSRGEVGAAVPSTSNYHRTGSSVVVYELLLVF